MLYDPKLNDQSLQEAVQGATALIVRSTKVTPAVLQTRELEIVVRAGAGVDNIDKTAAVQNGVYVCNCPGKNAVAVAELALGHMLAADRRLVH